MDEIAATALEQTPQHPKTDAGFLWGAFVGAVSGVVGPVTTGVWAALLTSVWSEQADIGSPIVFFVLFAVIGSIGGVPVGAVLGALAGAVVGATRRERSAKRFFGVVAATLPTVAAVVALRSGIVKDHWTVAESLWFVALTVPGIAVFGFIGSVAGTWFEKQLQDAPA